MQGAVQRRMQGAVQGSVFAAPPFHRAITGSACGGVAWCGAAAVGHGGGAGVMEPCLGG